MNDEATDLLSNDLENVSLKLPLLPKDRYRLTVKKVEEVESKNKPGNKLIKISLSLADPAKDTNGNPVSANFPLFDQISLTATENYTQDAIKRRLKTFRQAATGKTGGAFYPLEQYIGATVQATVDIQKGNAEYPDDRNVVKYELPKA